MKRVVKSAASILKKTKKAYNLKAAASCVLSFCFALYNAVLGLRFLSLWYGSICLYYFLLALIRGMILLTEKRVKAKCEAEKARIKQKVFTFSTVLLLLLNLALICPVSLLAVFERPVNLSLISAITVAAYTTCKITVASVNICKRKNRNNNIFAAELRNINFIDALMSVLILQNTLITVNSPQASSDMLILTAVSSIVIYITILFITIRMMAKGFKSYKSV